MIVARDETNDGPRVRSLCVSFGFCTSAFVFMLSISCANSNDHCRRHSFSSTAHHAASHHACIRSDAHVILKHDGVHKISKVVAGDEILTEHYGFVKVAKVVCHMGPHPLWKMPGLPPATTANHPIKIHDRWYAGDIDAAYESFGMNVSFLGEASNLFADSVCSVDTVIEHSVSIVIVANGQQMFVADRRLAEVDPVP